MQSRIKLNTFQPMSSSSSIFLLAKIERISLRSCQLNSSLQVQLQCKVCYRLLPFTTQCPVIQSALQYNPAISNSLISKFRLYRSSVYSPARHNVNTKDDRLYRNLDISKYSSRSPELRYNRIILY